MTINKRAKNIRKFLRQGYRVSVSGEMAITSEKIFIYATKEDLTLNSNKKIIANGNR